MDRAKLVKTNELFGTEIEVIEGAVAIQSDQEDSKTTREKIDDQIYVEAKNQRSFLLKYLSRLTIVSFLLVVVITFFQAIMRISRPQYTVFAGREFEILCISVFGEALGVIVVITRRVWALLK